MKYENVINDKYIIPFERFNNQLHIEERVSSIPKEHQNLFHAVLDYLYNDNGTTNMADNKNHIIEMYLDNTEKIVAKWLKTRTNGSKKRRYGYKSLLSARSARYRCSVCGFPDIRVLELDHIDKDNPDTDFACLCANCHNIKSREMDW
ncbi:MAG: hypothetical protein ACYDEX_08160 [Mobilitalea sp.]